MCSSWQIILHMIKIMCKPTSATMWRPWVPGGICIQPPRGPFSASATEGAGPYYFCRACTGLIGQGGKIAKTSVWGGSSRGGREGSGSSEFSEEYMQSAPSFPPKIRYFWGFPTDRSGTSWDMKLESSAEQSETQNMNC